jgi:hypothetical protein
VSEGSPAWIHRVHPRRPRGLHQPRRLRSQPHHARQQRRCARLRPRRRTRPGRPRPAARDHHLRALRPEDDPALHARLLLTDVTVTRNHGRTGDQITAHVRLRGGQDHTLTFPAPLSASDQRRTPTAVIKAIDTPLETHTSSEIADELNQRGLVTGTGDSFHRLTVDHVIRTYQLTSRYQRLRERGLLTLTEAATAYGASTATIKAWRRAGIVGGLRYNEKGERLYPPADPEHPRDRPKIGRPPKAPAGR